MRIGRTNSCALLTVGALLALGAFPGCSDATGPAEDPERPPQGNTGIPTGFQVALLGTLGGDFGWAAAINDRDEVVGVSRNAGGDLRAFLWQGGEMVELPGLGGSFSGAYDISEGGLVVGEAETASGEVHAVLWRDGEPTDLGTLGGSFSQAKAINERGQVVGAAETAAGVVRPFLWSDGEMVELPVLPGAEHGTAEDVDAEGRVVGWSAGGDLLQLATLWRDGEAVDLGTLCNESGALAINDAGTIVGGSFDCRQDEILPVRWEAPGDLVVLEPIGGRRAEGGLGNAGSADGLNEAGRIVGSSDADPSLEGSRQRATLWAEEEVVNLGTAGDAFSWARDVNERTVAVGFAGVPAMFVPDSEPDPQGAVMAPEGPRARDVPGPAAAVRVSPSARTAPWASDACRLHARVSAGWTAAGLLAGC